MARGGVVIPVASLTGRGWQVAIDGHVLLSNIEPWVVPFPGEATRSLAFQPPAPNGVVLDVDIDIAGDEKGTAHVTLYLPTDEPGHEPMEAAVRDVDGVSCIVPVEPTAPRKPTERMLLAIMGPYRGTFDDVDALLEELGHLGSLPVRLDRPARRMGSTS